MCLQPDIHKYNSHSHEEKQKPYYTKKAISGKI